ncbi:MAG TPA: UDP-glucose/GDP-mannose dehydrogenase family protein [Candidatus Saccharimonadales bacterium]
MNISVIGTGYVGLVTGVCLADAGHRVVCIDNNKEKIAAMRRGTSPIYEPGLEEVMQRGIKAGRLSFTSNTKIGIAKAEAIFLALPTPPQEDGSADLSAVLAVAEQLGPILPNRYCVVINKSTVPVGTAEAVYEKIAANATSEFDVVSNPEFLREGLAVKDFMEPERIVVGISNAKSEQVMRDMYASFITEERPLYVTDPRTSELTKYAANTFLATKIGFMNEIAHLCERLGADVDVVRQAMGADSRIGPKFLYPGIGAGGSCFPKDTRALKHMADQAGYKFKILESAIEVNKQQYHVLSKKIHDHYKGDVAGKLFALWGLAFKPNTDDIREAPALTLIENLIAAGARVVAYDPQANDNVRAQYADTEGLQIVDTKEEALHGADALLIATEWEEFKKSALDHIKKALKVPTIFDGRNIFHPKDMEAAGFTHHSIGRPSVVQEL